MRKVLFFLLALAFSENKSFAESDPEEMYPHVGQWICHGEKEERRVDVTALFLKEFSCGVIYTWKGMKTQLFSKGQDLRKCQMIARDFAERLEEDMNFICVGRGDNERLPFVHSWRE
jgi:hypothetical protein